MQRILRWQGYCGHVFFFFILHLEKFFLIPWETPSFMGISQKEVSEREGQNHPYLFQPLFIEAVRSKTTSWIGQLTIRVGPSKDRFELQVSALGFRKKKEKALVHWGGQTGRRREWGVERPLKREVQILPSQSSMRGGSFSSFLTKNAEWTQSVLHPGAHSNSPTKAR